MPALKNRLAKTARFWGKRPKIKVLEGIENLGKYAGQYHYHFAEGLAEEIQEISY
jgi:hypothetical protein